MLIVVFLLAQLMQAEVGKVIRANCEELLHVMLGNLALILKTKHSPYVCSLAHMAAAKSLQSCPTLSDPMDCSLPGSSIHGIFQARVLEWGAIALHTWQMML